MLRSLASVALGGVAVKSPAFPNLEGLDKLALRNGVDIRPTLVRVLTDLYIQKSTHTPEEEVAYLTRALRLAKGSRSSQVTRPPRPPWSAGSRATSSRSRSRSSNVRRA